MGLIYRLDCEQCLTSITVRDTALAGAVQKAREKDPGPYTVRCPICGTEVWMWAEAAPLDLGLLREGADPFGGRRP